MVHLTWCEEEDFFFLASGDSGDEEAVAGGASTSVPAPVSIGTGAGAASSATACSIVGTAPFASLSALTSASSPSSSSFFFFRSISGHHFSTPLDFTTACAAHIHALQTVLALAIACLPLAGVPPSVSITISSAAMT